MLRRLGFLSLSHLTAPLSKYWKEKQIKKKKKKKKPQQVTVDNSHFYF